MDVSSLVTNLLPIGIVAFIYGLTTVVKTVKALPDGSAPQWLIAVPFCSGILAGFLHYFASTSSADLALLTVAKRVLQSAELGIAYGGASVILWEIRKLFFKGTQ